MAFSSHARIRAPLLTMLALTVVLTFLICVPSAFAATAFTVSPASGEVVTASDVSIHVVATSTVGLKLYSQLSVDGAYRGPTMVLSADKKTLTIDATFTGLKNGSHAVRLFVMETSGVTMRKEWTFTVSAPPKIAALNPGISSQTDTLTPVVSAVVSGNGSVIAEVTLLIDGQRVAATWEPAIDKIRWVADPCNGTISWVAPTRRFLDEGTYTAQVIAESESGRRSTATWSFKTHSEPAMAAVCTRCHKDYPAAHSMAISCETCHYRFYAPMGGACGDCHDGHGTEQLARRSCLTCHTNRTDGTHAAGHTPDLNNEMAGDFSKCTLCHERQLTREHGRWDDSTGKPLDCNTCHGAGVSATVAEAVHGGDRDCIACHPEATPGDPHTVAHTADDLKAGCVRPYCHASSNVVVEHRAKLTQIDQSLASECEVCHTEKNPNCLNGTDERDCSGCHTKHGDPDVLHRSGDYSGCSGCHAGGPDVSIVHGYNCAWCHENPDPAMAAKGKTGDCRSCHHSHDAM